MTMVVCIADSQGTQVARLTLEGQDLKVDGSLPGGLTEGDLACLGFVYYETDARGELVPRVREVPMSNSLDYLRALMDSLPPGYYLSQVDSESIEQQRQDKRLRFEQELALLDADGEG